MKLQGRHITGEKDLREASFEEPFMEPVVRFLHTWFSGEQWFDLRTSGSTGEPKVVRAHRSSLVRSAQITGELFQLQPGTRALMALPVEFIAGRMMLVRAEVLDWDLTVAEPSTNPLRATESSFDFAAITPQQADVMLSADPHLLDRIHTIIIGGSPVSFALESALANHPGRVYETYGMTETLTHAAIRRINGAGRESGFRTVPGFVASSSADGCLVLQADHLPESPVITTDLVAWNADGSFRITGRADDVVNSGGIKLHPALIEPLIADRVGRPFYLTSKPDQTLGQRLVVVIEGTPESEQWCTGLLAQFKELLPSKERPREVIFVPQFDRTVSGKIRRIRQ